MALYERSGHIWHHIKKPKGSASNENPFVIGLVLKVNNIRVVCGI